MKWETAPLGEVAAIERKSIQPDQLAPNSIYLGLEHIAQGGGILGMSTVADAQIASAKYAFNAEHVLFGKGVSI